MSRDINYSVSSLHVKLGENLEGLEAIAEDVAIERGIAVCETLFYVGAIRSLQKKADSSGALISCQAALVQSVNAQYEQQAAHLVPGQLYVNGKPLWALVDTGPSGGPSPQHERLRVAQQTQLCFAKTNVLPAIFNRADSRAEQLAGNGGLKPLFGDTARQIWHGARVDPERPLVIDRPAIRGALQSWFGTVSQIYTRAAQKKEEAAANPRLTTPKSDERMAEARVLSVYAQSFVVANVERFLYARTPHLMAWPTL